MSLAAAPLRTQLDGGGVGVQGHQQRGGAGHQGLASGGA